MQCDRPAMNHTALAPVPGELVAQGGYLLVLFRHYMEALYKVAWEQYLLVQAPFFQALQEVPVFLPACKRLLAF